MIGTIVRVIVHRPLGTYHPKHKDIYYSVNYGYIPGEMASDEEEQDAYILGKEHSHSSGYSFYFFGYKKRPGHRKTIWNTEFAGIRNHAF